VSVRAHRGVCIMRSAQAALQQRHRHPHIQKHTHLVAVDVLAGLSAPALHAARGEHPRLVAGRGGGAQQQQLLLRPAVVLDGLDVIRVGLLFLHACEVCLRSEDRCDIRVDGGHGARACVCAPCSPCPLKHTSCTRTCMMLGWLSALLMAASMIAIFSRFSWPLMAAGSTIVLTATTVPRHRPLYTCVLGGAMGAVVRCVVWGGVPA
jgi:hypothetical protein